MKLQNNFTTPEQSKRLLELGVPADSADMAYQALNGKCYSNDMCGWRVIPSVIFTAKPNWDKHEWNPCWSVGRLIEIYNICANYVPGLQLYLSDDLIRYTYIELLIGCFELAVNEGLIDFSKLEN